MHDDILSLLAQDHPWRDRLHCFRSVGSTNDHLKALARQGAPQGTAVIAGHQTGGHGRRGRSFHSPEGMGIYLSLLLRPDCPPAELMHLTCSAAVAACDAVERLCAFRPGIKWTNDLVYGSRKLGGILTELGFSPAGTVDWAIIGIGINCRQEPGDFPPDIADIAASLRSVSGADVPPTALAAALLDRFAQMIPGYLAEKETILACYRRDCITVGREISVLRGETSRHGTALSVDDSGALVVQYSDGTLEAVSSGEVSIRGMYGYV